MACRKLTIQEYADLILQNPNAAGFDTQEQCEQTPVSQGGCAECGGGEQCGESTEGVACSSYATGISCVCCRGRCVKNMGTQPYRYKIAVNGQYQFSNDPTERIRQVQGLEALEPCYGSFAYYVDYPGINGNNPCTLKVTAEAVASWFHPCKTMEFNYNLNFDNQGNPTGATLTSSSDSGVNNCGSEIWPVCPLTTAQILAMVDFSPPVITITRI